MDIREASDEDLLDALKDRGIQTIRTFKTRELRAEIERREAEQAKKPYATTEARRLYDKMIDEGLV